MTWTITLPMLPMSFNEWGHAHWAVRQRERKQLETAVHYLAREQRIPLATGKRAVLVTIHKGKRSRVLDDEPNLHARAKGLLDAMVNVGLLKGDDRANLEWLGVVEGERMPAKQTVVTISEGGS